MPGCAELTGVHFDLSILTFSDIYNHNKDLFCHSPSDCIQGQFQRLEF